MKPFYVGSNVYGIGKDYDTVTRYNRQSKMYMNILVPLGIKEDGTRPLH